MRPREGNMLNTRIVKLGLVKIVLFSNFLLIDQSAFAMFRSISTQRSEAASSQLNSGESAEESDSEVNAGLKRYGSPIERLGRIPYAQGSTYGFTYPYFELMNFKYGDLIYGIHVVRQIAMDEVRAHEIKFSQSFGAITADHFNKLIFFDSGHANSIFDKLEKLERTEMPHIAGLDPVDYKRFTDFLDQILRRLGLRTAAEWREYKRIMIEGDRVLSDSQAGSKDTELRGRDDRGTTDLKAEVRSEEEFYKMACDQAIRYTHSVGAKIHFILDGVGSLEACNPESRMYESYTSHELRVIFKLWMNEIRAEMAKSGGGLESHASAAAGGSGSQILDTVRFYRNGERVHAPWLDYKGGLLSAWTALSLID
jgi:hypothetical protein